MDGTAVEAIRALGGIQGHDARIDPTTPHVDEDGVSDFVFSVMHLLGLEFAPRIPLLSDRHLYAFEPARRFDRFAQLFGRRLDRNRIVPYWPKIAQIIAAIRDPTVTPSLILRKPSAWHQQDSLAASLR